MQKVLRPEDYEKYMSGEYGGSVQGSVTRLEDGVGMRNVRELYDGLALGYDRSPFTAGDDSVKVMRFRADTDAEISAYSSMGGKGSTDTWTRPYLGNGFTESIHPVVPESLLPDGSQIEPGAEIWTVRKDGTEVLDAQFRDGRWVKVP